MGRDKPHNLSTNPTHKWVPFPKRDLPFSSGWGLICFNITATAPEHHQRLTTIFRGRFRRGRSLPLTRGSFIVKAGYMCAIPHLCLRSTFPCIRGRTIYVFPIRSAAEPQPKFYRTVASRPASCHLDRRERSFYFGLLKKICG